MDFSADSQTLIVATTTSRQKLVDTATGQDRPLPAGISGDTIDIRPLGNGRLLVLETVTDEGWLADEHGLKVWDLTVPSGIQPVSGRLNLRVSETVCPPRPFSASVATPLAGVSADGRLVAAWTGPLDEDLNPLLKLFDRHTGQQLMAFRARFDEDFGGDEHIRRQQSVSPPPAFGTSSSSIIIGLAPPPRPAIEFSPDSSRVIQLDVQRIPEGDRFSELSKRWLGGEVPIRAMWDARTSPPRQLASCEAASLTFSPDSKWIITKTQALDDMGSPITVWKVLDASTFQKQGDWFPLVPQDPVLAPRGGTVASTGWRAKSSFEVWMANWFAWRSAAISPGVSVCELPTCREIAWIEDCQCFTYFPDGQSMAVARTDGTIAVWDLPPHRPIWVDIGLPVLFALLSVLGCWRCFRFSRQKTAPG